MERRSFIKKSIVFGTVIVGSGGLVACVNSNKKKAGDFVVKQFEDKDLAHFSYAILLGEQIVLIDPGRNPQIYYDYAQAHKATISAVIETHPHADFISSHLEISDRTKAKIYTSKLTNAGYAHIGFDEGNVIELSKDVKLKAINTPGHSPDSISIILEESGSDYAVFTGDALLFGSVGRPDLREYSGESATQRSNLAKQMFHTIHNKYAKLSDKVLVFPAHGAGSLCASGISDIKESTIGRERTNNFAFGKKNELEFVSTLLADQPYIPKYFAYDVDLNKKGAENYKSNLAEIAVLKPEALKDIEIIDARKAAQFHNAHLAGAINIPDGSKFPTWLGSTLAPGKKFYLIVNAARDVRGQLDRVARIGYEVFVEGVIVFGETAGEKSTGFEKAKFEKDQDQVLVLDIRSQKEAKELPVFAKSLNIPLPELEEKIKNLPTDRPIYVHCASGYRSAIGYSLIKKYLPDAELYDIGDRIHDYHKK